MTENRYTLVSYTGVEEKIEKIPDPATPLGTPEELKSTEELYLAAQHLEQYRHATREPADYYEEGLRQDPSDIRLNDGYGMLLMKRGDFTAAKKHFEKAIEKQTWKNPNPYNGECYFHLGLAQYYLGNEECAYDAFYKSTWSHETQTAGFYWLALLACKRKEYESALSFAEQSIIFGWHNMKVRALKDHTFHPWEGGEGKVSGQYRYALTHKALTLMNDGKYKEAIRLLTDTFTYPDNLGEGKLPNVLDNIAEYYIGCCYSALSAPEKATLWWEKASAGLDEPSVALYYNDQPSDTIFYQGLANAALGNTQKATKCYHQLKAFGEKHLFDEVSYDYFAVSLPELEVFPGDIQLRNTIDCNYLIALSEIDLGNYEKARTGLNEVLKLQSNHQGALSHLLYLENME